MAQARKNVPERSGRKGRPIRNAGLRLAVERAGGARSDLAKVCGFTRQAVSRWDEIPEGRVLRVAKAIGVRPKKLRPDLF